MWNVGLRVWVWLRGSRMENEIETGGRHRDLRFKELKFSHYNVGGVW